MNYHKIIIFLSIFTISLVSFLVNANQALAEPLLVQSFNSLLALTESQITFDFPQPTDAVKDKQLSLWSTFYFVHQAKNSNADNSIPLKNSQGNSLGIKLSKKDWCNAALEGTVQVTDDDNVTKTYNYARRGTVQQTNCRLFFSSLSNSVINAMNRSLFEPAKGPFGDGSGGFILVPYRSIAVDRSFMPLGTLIFIPDAKGKEITLSSGQKVKHDGYFFAADVGGAIKGNKIDTFLGITDKNPFSHVKSDSTKTFTAFIINDSQIKDTLTSLHKNDLPSVIQLNQPTSGQSFLVDTPVTFSGTANPEVSRIKLTIGPAGPYIIADLEEIENDWSFTQSFNTKGVNRPVTIQPFDTANKPLKPISLTITIR